MVRRMLILITVLAFSLSACNSTANSAPSAAVAQTTIAASTAVPAGRRELTVFAAASLTEAFTDLSRRFESRNPGSKVVLNFAGSQQLAQQLAQGAPADVFASADQVQMDAAIQSGRISADAVRPLVGNRLILVYAKNNPGNLQQLKDLARPGVKLVLADASVPVGRYSLEFLDRAAQNPDYGPNFKADVLKNVVSYEENVRSVLTKVALGEADAGIVYLSDLGAEASSQVGWREIPPGLNVSALYDIAPVQDSHQAKLAQAFIDYALSQEGQGLLAKYGFQMVQ